MKSAATPEAKTLAPTTKNAVITIKLDLAEIKAEQQRMKWMLGLILAGVASLVMKAFFPV